MPIRTETAFRRFRIDASRDGIDPGSGQILGPANGRVFFHKGQYWAVDSLGATWLAIRVG